MMLNWEEYIKRGRVRKTFPNKGKIKTLIELADNGTKTYSKLKLDEVSASIVFKGYYDSLRGICEAICLLKEYKIYSHGAVGLFFKNVLKEEAFFYKFDRYRLMRNGVLYYGESVPLSEAKQGIIEIQNIIIKLKEKYLKEFV